MAMTLSLDAPAAYGASFGSLTCDARSADPAVALAQRDRFAELARGLPPQDAEAIARFVDGGDALPIGTLNRLRQTTNPTQAAETLGLSKPRGTPMEPKPDPTRSQLWRLSDPLWAQVEALLAKLDPPNRGPARAEQRDVLDAVVNRAMFRTPWPELERFGTRATIVDNVARWVRVGAMRSLVRQLVTAAPELAVADWTQAMTKIVAGAYRTGGREKPPVGNPSPARGPKPRRAAAKPAGGSIAERLGIAPQPIRLGTLTIGDRVVQLLVDPRGTASRATHTFGEAATVILPAASSPVDVGMAVAKQLLAMLSGQKEDV